MIRLPRYPRFADESITLLEEAARNNPPPSGIFFPADDGRQQGAARDQPVKPKQKRPLLYRPVDLNDMYENLVIFSGSTVSTVEPELAGALNVKWRPRENRILFPRTASGNLLKAFQLPVDLPAPGSIPAYEYHSPPSSPENGHRPLSDYTELDAATITVGHLMKLQKSMIDHNQNLSFPFACLVEKCSETVLKDFVSRCEPEIINYKITLTEILLRVSGSRFLQEDSRFMKCLLSKPDSEVAGHCLGQAVILLCSHGVVRSGMPDRHPELSLLTACRFLLDAGATVDRTLLKAVLESENEELIGLTLDKAFSNPADFTDFNILAWTFKTCHFLGEFGKAKYLIELLAEMARKDQAIATHLRSPEARIMFFTPASRERASSAMNSVMHKEFDLAFGEIDFSAFSGTTKRKRSWEFWK
jgi:hypothetical protein